jgi:predicted nucleic acid-binding protein
MIHSVKFTCVLDTNVIYPIAIRDLLLWFAHYDLYTPKWSKHVFDELQEVMRRKEIKEDIIQQRIQAINTAFPDAMVLNYEELIAGIELPDPNDQHVVAAAIKTNAHIIVINNLKHFPEKILSKYGLYAKKADDFLTDIIDLNNKTAIEAFKELVLHKKNPPLDEFQVLERLRKNGLEETANYLHSQL